MSHTNYLKGLVAMPLKHLSLSCLEETSVKKDEFEAALIGLERLKFTLAELEQLP
jgi:hypothetical protein